MKTFDVPDTIALSKVQAFLADLGIDVQDCRELSIGMDGIRVELRARDDSGQLYATPAGDVAMHEIAIRLDTKA